MPASANSNREKIRKIVRMFASPIIDIDRLSYRLAINHDSTRAVERNAACTGPSQGCMALAEAYSYHLPLLN
jgi:hypothetical protein